MRNLRLTALRDSPDLFLEELADAEDRPASYWTAFGDALTPPGPNVMFVVDDEDNGFRGYGIGLVSEAHEGTGLVGGLWVDPASRRQGAGSTVVACLVDWAHAVPLERLELWVGSDRAAAIRLYGRAGFASTGRRQAAPRDGRWLIEMAMPLVDHDRR